MLGSTPAELLPTGGSIDPGTLGSAVHDHGAPEPAAACHEPTAAPPLLRGCGGGLVEADHRSAEPGAAEIDVVVAHLAPIRSHETLASSFSREANPEGAVVRAAYARVWADLALVVARRTTRRARIRAMTDPGRRHRVRGRG